MGNNCFLDNKGHYLEKSRNELKKDFNYILELWQKFLISQKINLTLNQDYYIHERNLYEVVKRLDKRRTYYYVFHRIDQICEYKEIALICYWINTLKPFFVADTSSKIYNAPNEMFSLYIIIATLSRIHKEKFPNEDFEMPDPFLIRDYVYNFKYCDLSREATISFVETLAKSYGIGMDAQSINP